MDEHKEEVGFVSNFTEPTDEASDERLAAKAETLGGGSQLHEVNDGLDSSAEKIGVEGGGSRNGDKIPVNDLDSGACIDGSASNSGGLAGENPNHGDNLKDEGDTGDNLDSKGKSEVNGEEKDENTVSFIGTEVTDEKRKPEAEIKNTEAQVDVERAEKGEGGEGKEPVEKSEEESKEMDIDREDSIQEEKGDKVSALRTETGNLGSEAIDSRPSETMEAQNEQSQVGEGVATKIMHGGVEEKDGDPDTASEAEIASGGAEHDFSVDTCPKEQLHVSSKGEGEEGAIEIDSVNENLSRANEDKMVMIETVGVGIENVGENESANTSTVEQQTQEVSVAEANLDNSSTAKEMEIEKQDAKEQKVNVVETVEAVGGILSKESTNPDGASEGLAAIGQGEPPDHNVLFDPNSDIVKFIDFSGALSWPGDAQEIKIETTGGTVASVDGQEDLEPRTEVQGSAKNILESKLEKSKSEGKAPVVAQSDSNAAGDMEIEKFVTGAGEGTEILKQPEQIHEIQVAEASDTVEEGSKPVSNSIIDGLVSGLGSDNNLDSEGDKEGKAQESSDKKVEGQDMQGGEQVVDGLHSSKQTDPDGKVNDRKRKADILADDSLQESRKTISMAKVSNANQSPKPSFKIGDCIARAATHMVAVPSILKGNNNLNDEDLSPANLLAQLHLAATGPAKGHNRSDIFTGFFSDYRNSVASDQYPADKVCGKRNRLSNTSEAFEFEDMSDTYWTDRVIDEGGQEQQPSNEKGSYQIVPVELKPTQIQRGRRPYTRRKYSDNNNNNSHPADTKPAHVDENSPAELVMNFSETDTIPSETNLTKMFRHFGPIRESQTEVDRECCRARVVFKKCSDAEVAYNSAGKFSIFGSKAVNYELSYNITEHFKVQPYVVSLGEEGDTLCLPSES